MFCGNIVFNETSKEYGGATVNRVSVEEVVQEMRRTRREEYVVEV